MSRACARLITGGSSSLLWVIPLLFTSAIVMLYRSWHAADCECHRKSLQVLVHLKQLAWSDDGTR